MSAPFSQCGEAVFDEARFESGEIALEIDDSIEFPVGIDAAESFVNAVGAAGMIGPRYHRVAAASPRRHQRFRPSLPATKTGPTSASIARRHT